MKLFILMFGLAAVAVSPAASNHDREVATETIQGLIEGFEGSLPDDAVLTKPQLIRLLKSVRDGVAAKK